MREPTSGTNLPHATYTWPIANQAIAAGANFTPAAVAVPGAVVGNGIAIARARALLPATAAGSSASVEAVIGANTVQLRMSNASAAALVATAADIVFDIMVLPVTP